MSTDVVSGLLRSATSIRQKTAHALMGQSKPFADFRHCCSNAIDCYDPVVTRITRLFFARGPTDIAWLVVTVVVDAIKRVTTAWARTDLVQNVGPEILKRSPAFTNRDAASSVKLPVRCVRVSAALEYVVPNIVLLCASTSTQVAMFDPSATTRARAAKTQLPSFDDSGLSALAPTKPMDSSIDRLSTQRRESTELLTLQIDDFSREECTRKVSISQTSTGTYEQDSP
jgi:hypothetical protein